MNLHQPNEVIKDPLVALEMLKDGNKRYLNGMLSEKGSYLADCDILFNGQHPFAVVLCCSDSRVAPEIFFDQKLGDIFVVRNAGNIVDPTVLGSIEYAIEHLSTSLIVICGHSNCGAVTAACSDGNLTPNIKSITDRMQKAKQMGGDIDKVIRNNVKVMVQQVIDDTIIEDMGAKVLGAYYDIHTGEVIWL